MVSKKSVIKKAKTTPHKAGFSAATISAAPNVLNSGVAANWSGKTTSGEDPVEPIGNPGQDRSAKDAPEDGAANPKGQQRHRQHQAGAGDQCRNELELPGTRKAPPEP